MAASFTFSLEAVLEHRRHRERQAQVVLGRHERILAAMQRHLTQAGDLYARAQRDAAQIDRPFDAAMHNNTLYYLEVARRGVVHAQERVQAAGQECQTARQALLQEARARQGLERLREQRREEFERERARRTELALDDLLSTRYATSSTMTL